MIKEMSVLRNTIRVMRVCNPLRQFHSGSNYERGVVKCTFGYTREVEKSNDVKDRCNEIECKQISQHCQCQLAADDDVLVDRTVVPQTHLSPPLD